MLDCVSGDANVDLAIARQHGVAAIGVAGTAREITAGDVDFEAVAGAKGMTNVAEIDGQALDAIRRNMAQLAGRVAIHGADHAVHHQHRTPVRMKVDQLGDKIGIGAVRLHGKGHAHLAGNPSPEASSAAAAFAAARSDLFHALGNCSSGREMMQRDYDQDVVLAAELDTEPAVPLLVQRGFRAAPSAE